MSDDKNTNPYTWRLEEKFQYELLKSGASWKTVKVLNPNLISVDVPLTVQRSKNVPFCLFYKRIAAHWWPCKHDEKKIDRGNPCSPLLNSVLQEVSEDWSRRLLENIL